MTTVEAIEDALRTRLRIEHVEVIDDSWRHAGHAGAAGGGGHYIVTVVSPDFAGKAPVERHRLVYEALGTQMQRDIHALALTTRAPGEAA
jgi:BolA protein